MKLIDFLKKNPQVYDIPIKRPIFVFGLGRSGTTYVHRLLSMDPKLRAPRLWELLAPTPMISGDSTVAEFAADRAHRNKIVRDAVAKRTKLGVSAMDQFHEIGADLPEECMMGVSTDLPTCFQYLYTCLCQPQIFTDNIKGKPVVDAYKRYKSILQLLSYQTKVNDDDDGSGHNRNWLLKFPVHILFIKELAEAFPDARMIWAHRHPLPTVASLSAMMCALHSIYYEKETCDPKEVGENMAELCDKALVKAIKDLEETGLETSHVIFNNLVEDPISVVKGIYKDLNMEYTQEFEDNMIAYMKQNNAERAILKAKVEATGKIFDYQDPADYGLSLDGLLQKKGYHKYLDSFHFDSIK